ncbi:glycosyl transferase family group 2-domain-containing protein [Halteromyces radiatus]|uniref:glycosyl transferase family group 2-domain-containing protein n=1 Tax=Halteromyces radiatus TaxID=101107 RepID=UPI00221F5DFE|nr:glycosyl transferase family group 2-domain-containing protein [Halteromyces radiatus]KAI8082760.1 glycosyl transferase family group 2-domain-containing protein [Halteromyces radiatus]
MSRLHSPSEWVAPLVPLLSLLILPLGPLLFPRVYLFLLFTYFTVFLYTQVNHVCKFYMTSCKIQATISKWNRRSASHHIEQQPATTSRNGSPNLTRERNNNLALDDMDDIEQQLDLYEDPTYIHTFIIPNYCEPEGLLKDTIGRMANHRNAKTHYAIIMAMEQSESEWEQKGQRLASVFADRFAYFIVTGHPANIPGESRGKGSNVAYAARNGCAELLRRGVDRRRVILTVTDSDSAIPELYVREVEDALHRADDPHYLLLAPPIFFSRNCYEVPAAVRVTDITWSAMVMSNLSNSRGLSFPCSTYSLSMMLAERVGYWDTDADAVGEDMHMWLKCFFKTNGQVRTAPIYVPINLTNVQTEGYLSNVNARYVQAKRHYNGVADVAYTLKNAFTRHRGAPKGSLLDDASSGLALAATSSVSWLDKVTVCFLILEAHMIPATSGWLMFAAVPLMQFLLFPPFSALALVDPAQNPILTSDFYAQLWNMVKIITVLLPFPLFGTLAIYEQLHRAIDREFLQKSKSESRQWKHLLDYTNLPVAAWLFMTLPSTLACVKRLSQVEQQYIVSEKLFKDEDTVMIMDDLRQEFPEQKVNLVVAAAAS